MKSFLSIAAPITKLTYKKEKFLWSDACETSFERLKNRFTMTVVLMLHMGT